MVAGLVVSFAGGYYGNKMFAGKTNVVDGVGNPEISRIDYLRNKYGTLTSEQKKN